MLPAEADRTTTRYLALVDAAAPGVVEGLYLVGSVALDDFHPRASDVDFIAASSEPVSEVTRPARGTGSWSADPIPLSSPCTPTSRN